MIACVLSSIDTDIMEQITLILSTEFGPLKDTNYSARQSLLAEYALLAKKLSLKLEICVGSSSEDWIQSLSELDDIKLHFSSSQMNILEHSLDAVLSSPGLVLLQATYPAGPLLNWLSILDFTCQEPKLNEEKFYRFSKNIPGPKPLLITKRGKSHLLHLFREKKLELIRDFDWRFAKFVAKNSIAKKHDSQRDREASP